ncbi:hypothetical protein AMTRI_Chr07g28120 [Amborella trichopoda]
MISFIFGDSSLVDRIRNGLSKIGIRPGDVVLIFAPNSFHFASCFFGVVSLGAIATTVNPMYTSMEVAKQVKDSMEGMGLPAVILDYAKTSSINSQMAITYYSDLRKMGAATTPRGFILTHGNFIAASLMVASDQDWKGEIHNRFLCVIPMFHMFGLSILTYTHLQRGNAVIIMSRVTHLFVVPPIMIALAKQSMVSKYDLSSLTCVSFSYCSFPNAEAGEVSIAYVYRSQGSSLTKKDIAEGDLCEKSAPKSASGKILRRELIEKVRLKM